jgi:type IV pilus assembly protein PilP
MAGLLVSALGCGDEAPPPAAAPAAPVAPKPAAAPAAAVPEAQPQVEYSYNPINKRDPFRSLDLDVARATSDGEDTEARQVCTEPLCQFDLDELTVVAVVSGDANPLAMVEDSRGVGYLVRRNTKIGKNGGKVSQVLRDCIVVTSFISGPDNKAQAVKDTMCVKTDVRSRPPLDLLTGKATQ